MNAIEQQNISTACSEHETGKMLNQQEVGNHRPSSPCNELVWARYREKGVHDNALL